MWLVLSPSSDASAIWAWQGLGQLGLAPLEFVSAEDLASALTWQYRLEAGTTCLQVRLADGRVLNSAQIRGSLNRLHMPSPLTLQSAAPSDREYAQSEFFAFYLSWLHSLPGVMINRPRPLGLSGPWLHLSEWMMRAARAGLRTAPYRQSGRDSANEIVMPERQSFGSAHRVAHHLIAFGGEIFGGCVPAEVAAACGRLAKDVDAAMLGITLFVDEFDRWTLAGATPSPDLALGGMPLLRRMAQILLSGGLP